MFSPCSIHTPLLELRVAEGVPPHGHRPLQLKILDQRVAVRCDGSAGPAIGPQRIFSAVVAGNFIDLSHQHRAAHRRLQSGNQQSMVAARQIPADGARGKPADTVGHQPFTLLGHFQHSADFAAKFHDRGWCRGLHGFFHGRAGRLCFGDFRLRRGQALTSLGLSSSGIILPRPPCLLAAGRGVVFAKLSAYTSGLNLCVELRICTATSSRPNSTALLRIRSDAPNCSSRDAWSASWRDLQRCAGPHRRASAV